MRPQIPPPTIFLRNEFSIKPGLQGSFFKGQEALLAHTKPKLRLVAAFGRQPLVRARPAPMPLPSMMHLWQLPAWDSLYEAMYTFSETDWYTAEVQSLEREHQDLLVGTGQGIELDPRPSRWVSADEPGYIYLYEQIRLGASMTKLSYLRHLNYFVSYAREKGWRLMWVASEITGTPSQICLLWWAPDVDTIEKTIRDLAYEPPFADRYANMMLGIEHISREYMYPESTEHIDNELPPQL